MKCHRFFFLVLFLILMRSVVIPFNAFAIEDYPGATWGVISGELRHPGENDFSAGGWIEQGIIWTHWGDTRLNTYARLNFGWDTAKHDWNNFIGPGVGIALEIRSFKWVGIRTGIEYDLEQRYRSGTTIHRAIAYIGWYGAWTLKKK